jgi:SulP family sulfate permease
VLIVAASLRLGRATRYLPSPVIEGFTAGIADVIVLQQVPAVLGTPGKSDKAWQSAFDSRRHFVQHPQAGSLTVAMTVTALIRMGTRWRPAVPVSLAAVGVAGLVVALFHLHMTTLGTLPSAWSDTFHWPL